MNNHVLLLSLCLPLTLANEALQEFTTGNNLFAASVYKEITATKNGNFLISPISVETILGLTLSGTKDDTAEELRTGLHLPVQETTHAAIKHLHTVLYRNDTYTLHSANKIYLKNDFSVRDDFKRIAVEVFGSEVENVDFGQKEAAVKAMNDWVEERTQHKIKDLISLENIERRTKAILINALYFKANWSSPFELHLTKKQDFYKNGNEALQVDMMHCTELRNYYEDEELKAKFLEIPFEGEEATLTIVLPNEKDGIFNLEKQMERVVATPKFATENVIIALPRFKIESKINFKEVLQKVGVKKIFDEEKADLSGIAGEKGDLIVDKVIQKTFVDVNEEGVEAAAATFVDIVYVKSGLYNPVPPKEFIADHPFIFYIKVKDLIIFAGRVVDPSL